RKMYSPKLREPAGWYAARDFCCAGAACLPLRREEGERNRPLSVRLDATDGCRKPRPAPDPCFGVVLCNEYRNFNVSRRNWTRTAARDCELRRQQDLAAGGRQIGHPQPRLGLRRRRRPRVENGVGGPI